MHFPLSDLSAVENILTPLEDFIKVRFLSLQQPFHKGMFLSHERTHQEILVNGRVYTNRLFIDASHAV